MSRNFKLHHVSAFCLETGDSTLVSSQDLLKGQNGILCSVLNVPYYKY